MGGVAASELASRFGAGFRQPTKFPAFFWRKFRETFLWQRRYARLREPKTTALTQNAETDRQLIAELREAGFRLLDYSVDVEDYRAYARYARYNQFPNYYRGGRSPDFVSKSLQHYLAAQLLSLGPDDVYIDVASGDSPAPEIYQSLYECRVYRQDLRYPRGIRGNRIGGNATAMPVENGFATKIGLHCSFEHFEGAADIEFMREATRVLKPGGKVCIIPLYLYPQYTIVTDPVALPRQGIAFEDDAVLYCWKGYGNRHGRLYSVTKLASRIRDNLNGMELTVYFLANRAEFSIHCNVRFAAVMERKSEPIEQGI
jgi:SAM-dependent methyltransferase